MSQKDDRDLDAPTPPGSPMRRDEPSPTPAQPEGPEHRDDEQEDLSEEER